MASRNSVSNLWRWATWTAVTVVIALTACAEGVYESPDGLPADLVTAPGAVLAAAGPAADSSLATVAEIPGWEEVVRELDYRECAVYWRGAGGEYTLDVAQIEYSAEATSGPYHAVQVATLLLETSIVGVRAHCLFPYTEAGREELLEHLSFMFPADVPGEGGEDGPQADGDGDPCPEYEGEGKATHQCPNITATVVKPCPVGFDRDKYSGACVSNFTINTGNPGGGPSTGGPGGSSPGSTTPPDDGDDEDGDDDDGDDEEDDEEIPVCSPDQIAIAEEYAAAGYSSTSWPCDVFTDAILNGGEHSHATGFLTDSYLSGSAAVLSAVPGSWINSDWRCPVGNASLRDSSPTSLHILGRAGDFDAPNFNEALYIRFAEAAAATGGGTSDYRDPETGKCRNGGNWCYSTYIHIYW